MIHLTLQERRVLLLISCLFVLGILLTYFKKTGCNSCLISLYSGGEADRKIDINKASREDLVALPEIGEKSADAILQWRNTHGDFKDLSQLKEIKAMTDKKIKILKDYLYV